MLSSLRKGFEQSDCEQQWHKAVGKAYSSRQASQNSINKADEVQTIGEEVENVRWK